MNQNEKFTVLLDQAIAPALHDAFLKAAERAKQTHTYLVLERNGQIERIPYDKIDDLVIKQKEN